MPSKSGRKITLDINVEQLKHATILGLEPLLRTMKVLSPYEEVSELTFEVSSNMTVVPVTMKIKRDKEVYLEEYNG